MMRSMFSGVSSLRVHQTRMDVIANNIANVNTVGFKSQRATFADAFYQRIQGASGPDATTGRAGTNPQQIGLGLNLGSIDNIMTQGATQRTDRAMDVTLTGPGFLIVQDQGGQFFTRAGNIGRDFHNNLHINGMQLMGWSTRLDESTGQHVVDRSVLQPLQLSGDKQSMPAEPTDFVNLVGNLNITQLSECADTGDEYVLRTMAIFDSLGNRYLIDVRFTFHREFSEAAEDSPHSYWTFEFLGDDRGVFAFLEGDRDVEPVPRIALHANGSSLAGTSGEMDDVLDNMQRFGTIAFDSRGAVLGVGTATGTPGTGGRAGNLTPIQFLPDTMFEVGVDDLEMDDNGETDWAWRRMNDFNMYVFPVSGVAPAATFGRTAPGDGGLLHYDNGDIMIPFGTIRLGMGELFQRGGMNTTMRALTMTGNGPGELQDISIGSDGTIMGRFSNGRTRVLGQIPLAFFQNPEGLERMGANLWVPTANSGPFDGVGQIGTMQGGALEMSNVDLANEFTEMITTQRGFQAASRTISVSDEMLQELVNLRR